MVSFHVEATSKCTLECPLCDRTWFYENFKKRNLHEINLDQIVKFIGKGKDVNFCGNNGDPIYHSQFLDLCLSLKHNDCRLSITTNGSAKKSEWWRKLNGILDQKDSLTFSIDGLRDSNHIYRKNANYDSIMTAVQTLRNRKFKMVWKFIVFKHNQHQIKQAKDESARLNFDHFKLEHSHRWLGGQSLMPDNQHVDQKYKHQKNVLDKKNYHTKMKPSCLEQSLPMNSLYIDAEGDFYPCCWMGSYRYRYKTLFSPKTKPFNIKNTTIEQILKNESVVKFFESTKKFTSAHECCKIHCGVTNG
jgi:organic radical activating enzyme